MSLVDIDDNCISCWNAYFPNTQFWIILIQLEGVLCSDKNTAGSSCVQIAAPLPAVSAINQNEAEKLSALSYLWISYWLMVWIVSYEWLFYWPVNRISVIVDRKQCCWWLLTILAWLVLFFRTRERDIQSTCSHVCQLWTHA